MTARKVPAVPDVLVLDGNENQAVAAVRALDRSGRRALVGSDTAWSKAGWSRHCRGRFHYEPPDRDTAAFVRSIVDVASRHPGALVMPMTERTTLPLSASRDTLIRAGARMVLPAHDALLRAFDKQETTRLAASLGIDVPATVAIASDDDLRAAAAGLRYPVVLKPRQSEEDAPSTSLGTHGALRPTGAPAYARSRGELERAWRAMSRRCRSALVQEFVAGAGVGYFALARHGEARAEFAHRRLRDVRPTGSGSALRVSIEMPPRVRAAGRAMLAALGWHGVAMVEFRMRADGTPTFLEVNGRFWNSLALSIHAGVNFPALLAALAEDGDVVPPAGYSPGVRCRWLLGDARHLVEVWRGAPAGYPGRFPSRLGTLLAVLTPRPGTHHDNFEWRDPLPAFGDWLHFFSRQVPRASAVARAEGVWHAGRPSHT